MENDYKITLFRDPNGWEWTIQQAAMSGPINFLDLRVQRGEVLFALTTNLKQIALERLTEDEDGNYVPKTLIQGSVGKCFHRLKEEMFKIDK